MSEFKEFKVAVANQFSQMVKNDNKLFITSVDKDLLWQRYLDSFPEGTNPVYKERQEYDCNCCKQFIRNAGNVVVIGERNELISIWDIAIADKTFEVVSKSLSDYVKSFPVKEIFKSKFADLGTDKNHQQLPDGSIKKWEHFYYKLPKIHVDTSSDSIESIQAGFRDAKNVFKRSMDDLTLDAGEAILDLINQKSLYRGEEFSKSIKTFIDYKKNYNNLPENQKDNWCWVNSFNNPVAKIRNTAIGTLLIDISANVGLDEAVRKFEAVVAPTNYKRPTAIFTQRMVEDAQKKIEELGYSESLARKFATVDDITVNNIIFANRDTKSKMNVSPLDLLVVADKPKKLDKVEEISIEDFVNKIVPTTTDIEIMVEGKHTGNLMTLIAPANKNAPSMLKWNNNFSWCYNGDIADSMKQRVKEAGGKVDGVLRFSIQWNDNNDNESDLDAHCIEPNGNEISFRNKKGHGSKGNLDVDIINPMGKVAVENITWPELKYMQEGRYELFVECYSTYSAKSGFSAEIEYNGQIYSYSFDRPLRSKERVTVAQFDFTKKDGIKFVKSLDASMSSKEIWSIPTNKFQKVSMMMYSPNYWDDQKGIGNKHYFFIIDGCKNESNPRGFFNEFLKEELNDNRKVFEALGSKMKVVETDTQLSGVGFSSTQRNDVVVKVTGAITRMLKIIF